MIPLFDGVVCCERASLSRGFDCNEDDEDSSKSPAHDTSEQQPLAMLDNYHLAIIVNVFLPVL
jgi:hypothetical protein